MKNRSRFRIQMTKAGYLFCLLNLGVGFAGLNTGNNLLYLVFSMMLSFIVLSGLLSNNTLYHLDFVAQFPHRIYATDRASVELTLTNQKRWFPSFSLSFSPELNPNPTQKAFILKIPPGGTEKTVDYFEFPKRGKAKLPNYCAETYYPFGLIRKFIQLKIDGETIVYPKILPTQTIQSLYQNRLGDYLSGKVGGSANPYGIRDYVLGDSSRNIHWKSSARFNNLKIKEFEQEKRYKVGIELHLRPLADSSETHREKAISLAASLLLDLIDRGLEVSLYLLGNKIEPHGRGYIDAYLTSLALIEPPEKKVAVQFNSTDPTIVISDEEISITHDQILALFTPKDFSRL